MDYESSVNGLVSANRNVSKRKGRFDDIIYLLIGEATIANIIILIFTITMFASVPVAMLLLFGTYSGGMRWMITLGMIVVMGSAAIYLMKMGIEKKRGAETKAVSKTEFKGELTDLTDAMERAGSGYAYSQQMLRERLCEDMMNKLGVIRGLSQDEMNAMLEFKRIDFIGDEVLASFLLENRRGTKGWEDMQVQTKGKSLERGDKFMNEIDDILKRTEAIV